MVGTTFSGALRMFVFVLGILLTVWILVLHPFQTVVLFCFWLMVSLLQFLHRSLGHGFLSVRGLLLAVPVVAIVVAAIFVEDRYSGARDFGSDVTTEVLGTVEDGNEQLSVDDLLVRRTARLAFSDDSGLLTSVNTLQFNSVDLSNLLGLLPAELSADDRVLATQELMRELPGWQVVVNSADSFELRSFDTLRIGDLNFVGSTDRRLTTFEELSYENSETGSTVRLLPSPESSVVIAAPCHAVISSSLPPSSTNCFGKTAEWTWESQRSEATLEVSFVHPYFRSGIGAQFVNRTSGSVFAFLIMFALLPLLKRSFNRYLKREADPENFADPDERELDLAKREANAVLQESVVETLKSGLAIKEEAIASHILAMVERKAALREQESVLARREEDLSNREVDLAIREEEVVIDDRWAPDVDMPDLDIREDESGSETNRGQGNETTIGELPNPDDSPDVEEV